MFTAVHLVVALQVVLAAVAAIVGWTILDVTVAKSVALGSGCVVTATVAGWIGQRLVAGRSASRVLWGLLSGEALKVVVASGLLFWGLSAQRGPAAAPFVTGFIVALLAYLLALPLATGKQQKEI